jgi:hypothetical protein
MAAQRHDAGARASDVAQQQLQQRRAADDLHAVGVLRPGHGIGDRGRASAPELSSRVCATRRNSRGQPVTCSTISGV